MKLGTNLPVNELCAVLKEEEGLPPKASVEFKHLKRRMGLELNEDGLTWFPCEKEKRIFSNLSYTIDSLQRRKREEKAWQ